MTMRKRRPLRSRRVFQFALLVFIAFSGTAARCGLQSRWDVVLSLGLGAALMLPCQWLNHRGHHDAAAGMALPVATLSLFSIMWFSDGLRDSSLLGLSGHPDRERVSYSNQDTSGCC